MPQFQRQAALLGVRLLRSNRGWKGPRGAGSQGKACCLGKGTEVGFPDGKGAIEVAVNCYLRT